MRFDTWDDFMAEQRRSGLLGRISDFVTAEHAAGAVYPPSADVFAFTTTPLRDVKVVILGQDPYHGPGQAHGLAFSVRAGMALPPTLKNIFRELDTDLSVGTHHESPPTSGDLTPWTRQGVLLFNTALTVRHGQPGSHCDIWQPFTDEVLRAVVDSATAAPHFILWGRHAREAVCRAFDRRFLVAAPNVNGLRSTLLSGRRVTFTTSAHPSPLSANRGFFGSRPFSRANAALQLGGVGPVDWRLP